MTRVNGATTPKRPRADFIGARRGNILLRIDFPAPSADWEFVALKLSSRQQAQLAFLETLPPRIARVHSVIEQMAGGTADDAVVRGLCRLLDEVKAKAQALSLTGFSETAGLMGTMARRTGSLPVRVRGLRELLGSLRINHAAAVKKASTPERDDEAVAT